MSVTPKDQIYFLVEIKIKPFDWSRSSIQCNNVRCNMRAVVTDVRRPGHRTRSTDVGEVVTRVLSHANQMSHTHQLSLIGHTLTLLINYDHAMES